jgi:hypothetical protein
MHETGSLEATRDLLDAVKDDLNELVSEQRGDNSTAGKALEKFLDKLYISR